MESTKPAHVDATGFSTGGESWGHWNAIAETSAGGKSAPRCTGLQCYGPTCAATDGEVVAQAEQHVRSEVPPKDNKTPIKKVPPVDGCGRSVLRLLWVL